MIEELEATNHLQYKFISQKFGADAKVLDNEHILVLESIFPTIATLFARDLWVEHPHVEIWDKFKILETLTWRICNVSRNITVHYK